jgi:hypothetical protein
MDINAFEASLLDPPEWVGAGKKYGDIPQGVALAAQEVAIPSDIRDTVPRQDEKKRMTSR